MKKVILLDPLGGRKGLLNHRHLLRDWSGSFIPGYVPFPPIDLLYVASYLQKHGYDVQILEGSVKHWPNEKIVELVKKNKADYVFLPSTYFSLEDDKYLARLIRNCGLPNMKIVFAGPLLTYNPSLVLSDGTADFVVLGEYESLLNVIKGDYTENIAYVSQDKVICGKRTLIDLHGLPMPNRDLINNNSYRYAIFNKRNPVTTMSISRGCPHSKCKFCHSPLYTLGQIRYRDMDSIKEEINEIVYKYKIGEIFFRDQAFTANRELVFNICEFLISHNIDILWRVTTRVDLVDKQLLTLMKRAGCYQISFGFESCSQKALDTNNKGIKLEQSRMAAKWTKEAGIEILGLFMLGMTGGDDKKAKELLNFVIELNVDYLSLTEYFIFPGAPFYDEYIKNKNTPYPIKYAKTSPMLLYLNFYLRPRYIFKQIAKVSSLEDLKFLIKLGLNGLMSYF